MHIPDGLMDPTVALVGWIEFLVVISVAVYLSRKRISDKDLPKIAVLSAGVFVAQMLNFPIGGGTTGHLIGAALLAIMMGPWVAMLGMTVIIVLQALMFGDGGLTALGLNAVNMAVIAPLTGWGVYTLLLPLISKGNQASGTDRMTIGRSVVVAAAAWASVFVAAAACAAELAVSYVLSDGAYGIAAAVSVPAMLGYHAVIGVGEAMITVGVLAYVESVSPRLLARRTGVAESKGRLAKIISSRTVQATFSILLVFALALPLYFIYSSEGMDGLERTMDDAGVSEGEAVISSPFSYGEDYIAALLAGILGFLAVALVAGAVATVLKKGRVEQG